MPETPQIDRSIRKTLCAMALIGLLAFWAGLWIAGHQYPSEYDWRYMTISSLVYPDRNPHGYRWAWMGVTLCALGGLCWTLALLRDWRRENAGERPTGIWTLGIGYLCMISCVWIPGLFPRIPRGHDLLALMSFVGLCIGIVLVTADEAGRRLRLRDRTSPGGHRVYAAVLAGAALSPIVMAALTQAYVSKALPDLPWVGLEWRARGAPVYLSFAFWEWATCAVFSGYTASLSLAAMRM